MLVNVLALSSVSIVISVQQCVQQKNLGAGYLKNALLIFFEQQLDSH